MGQKKVSFTERCPYFRGCNVCKSVIYFGRESVFLERCPQFRGGDSTIVV